MPNRPAASSPTPPSRDEAQNKLLHTFGKCEIELAARVIVQKAAVAKSWAISIEQDDFRGDDLKMAGYHLLISHGWLIYDLNGRLYPSREFIARVRSTFSRDADPRTRMR